MSWAYRHGVATELAPVTPEVLKWARQSIGATLDDAAKRAGVTAERVCSWEAGDEEPTVAKLRELSKLYQRPLAVFFLPEPPTDFDTMRDFRRLPGQTDHTWSRALHKVYRRAVDQSEIIIELLEDEGEGPSVHLPSIELDADPEDAAGTARAVLRATLAEQAKWKTPDDVFRAWAEKMEDLGVFVLRTSDVDLDEMRGFSLSDTRVPVIVVNALDAPRGQTFTLLHEFMHLLLRSGGLCDTLEPETGVARRVEAWCNAAAAAAMMPKNAFLAEELVSPPGRRAWDDDVLQYLSGRYGASREAVLRRLVTLERATWDFYLAKREEYLEAYKATRDEEKERRRSAERKGGPPPYRMAIRDRGRPFVRLVLDAYHRDAISPSSASTVLGLKLKHLPSLEREIN